MKKILCVPLMLLFSVAARPSSAHELITIPLPGIEGRYSFPERTYGRNMHFELDRIPVSVNRVWIHITGVFSFGETWCNTSGTLEGPYPQGVEYLAEMKDTISGKWFYASSVPSQSGVFEYTSQFKNFYGQTASWDFLMAGYGNLYMNINFGLIPECWVTIWPEGTLGTAELIIEGDFPVAVDQSTWGSIKSLFR